VNAALHRALATFPETLLFGEDVAIPGGVFGATRGLLDEFGDERVFDTPIAESAILGAATGAAIQGLRPIAEIMWADFLLVALDQLVNQTANVRYVSRGRLQAPLVVRCQQGAAPGSCAQHSQSLEALLAHVPGLRVGLPSNPNDAYQMLLAAVASDDPCVLIESRLLYPTRGEVVVDGPIEALGGARVRRTGNDLVLISWGRMVATALDAAEALAADGIAAAVLDLRWLNPLDEEQIATLVRTTSRALVVHEANLRGGFGAEVAAWIGENCFADLDAEVMRIATPDVRMPAAPSLQQALLPSVDFIAAAARRLVAT
jgi:pyruvate/2-oxoglutarate/acetoin dehydrogenase E1 component